MWRLRDKLDQLSIFLVDKPQPKAEDRPTAKYVYWPLPETLEDGPKIPRDKLSSQAQI